MQRCLIWSLLYGCQRNFPLVPVLNQYMSSHFVPFGGPWCQSHLYQGRTSGRIFLARMHSSSDIMQHWLDFSSIYVIGQLASRIDDLAQLQKSSSKVERTGAPYFCLYASSIYVTHGWLELCHTRPAVFSSIYVIGQLYISRTVHTTKYLARPFILPY